MSIETRFRQLDIGQLRMTTTAIAQSTLTNVCWCRCLFFEHLYSSSSSSSSSSSICWDRIDKLFRVAVVRATCEFRMCECIVRLVYGAAALRLCLLYLLAEERKPFHQSYVSVAAAAAAAAATAVAAAVQVQEMREGWTTHV